MALRNIDEQTEMLSAQGRLDEAAQLLIDAAEAGDADALLTLALWRVAGDRIRRDLPAARDLIARAALAGQADAPLLHAYFLANGTGGPVDWPRAHALLERLAPARPAAVAQLSLLATLAIDAGGNPTSVPAGRVLSTSPWAVACEGFLPESACDYLLRQSEGWLQPSVVVDPSSGRTIPHPIRKSDGMMFGVFDEDLVVNAINRRIAAFSETAIEQGETLQILRYRRGGEYRAHVDALPGTDNQRVLTMLVYLSDDYEGGETCFLATGLAFKGRKGDALLFRNVTADGAPDPLAQHAGLPVTRGTKLIASRWIRQRQPRFPNPVPATGSRFG